MALQNRMLHELGRRRARVPMIAFASGPCGVVFVSFLWLEMLPLMSARPPLHSLQV